MNALPWQRRDRLVLGVLEAVGFGVLLLSWIGASGTTTFSRQVAWINVGGAGLIVALSGCVLWVSRGRRLVLARLGIVPPLPQRGHVVALTTSDAFVTVEGMTRYHRPDCQAVAGKSPITSNTEGLRPCGMCES